VRRVLPAIAREFALLAVVVAVAAIASPTAEAGKRKARQERPTLGLELRVSPRTGFAPLHVRAQVLAHDRRGALTCPQFALTWNLRDQPGDSSSFPGDYCGEGGPRLHAPRARLLPLRTPGEWVIAAAMADQGVALSARETVLVLGRTEE
jgi:hypothetical protein